MKQLLKICSRCKKEIPATTEYFYKSERGKYGLDSRCKICKKEYERERNALPEMRKHRNEYQIKWRNKNLEKVRAGQRASYKKHKDRYMTYAVEKYRNDPEWRERHKQHQIKYKESGKRALANSKPEIRKRANEYSKKYDEENKLRISKRNKQYRLDNYAMFIERGRKKIAELHDSYVKGRIKLYSNIANEDITSDMIERKRLIIQIKRELKLINST